MSKKSLPLPASASPNCPSSLDVANAGSAIVKEPGNESSGSVPELVGVASMIGSALAT
eukprot:CAMPEP_0183510362 /NCGR_PEP_ID=MMETSP0371-20130417/10269_1 /TAXON_ID=268820 /ORGANISM="Peridinium aciculiferum, Strain PAER-2" /LENGTH=57 /DNA_ID=CAMNT_0025707173 /DNA_START=1 /DNA_END=174 /DNA_ORIENTATION=-